jgi:hypothetical protein
MTFMCVLVVESLCQVVAGQFSALKCLVPGTHGSHWLRLALNDHVVRGRRLSGYLLRIGDFQVLLPGSWTHAEPEHKDELNQVDRRQDLARPRLFEVGQKDRCGSCPGLVFLSWWFPL